MFIYHDFGERRVQMHEKESPFPIADSHGRLECKEIWGGIRNRDIEVSAGKVIGSIYSASSEGGMGGDIYYFGSAKAIQLRGWLSQMLPVTVRQSRK